MKRLLAALIATTAITTAAPAFAAEVAYKLDEAHTETTFTIDRFGFNSTATKRPVASRIQPMRAGPAKPPTLPSALMAILLSLMSRLYTYTFCTPPAHTEHTPEALSTYCSDNNTAWQGAAVVVRYQSRPRFRRPPSRPCPPVGLPS